MSIFGADIRIAVNRWCPLTLRLIPFLATLLLLFRKPPIRSITVLQRLLLGLGKPILRSATIRSSLLSDRLLPSCPFQAAPSKGDRQHTSRDRKDTDQGFGLNMRATLLIRR